MSLFHVFFVRHLIPCCAWGHSSQRRKRFKLTPINISVFSESQGRSHAYTISASLLPLLRHALVARHLFLWVEHGSTDAGTCYTSSRSGRFSTLAAACRVYECVAILCLSVKTPAAACNSTYSRGEFGMSCLTRTLPWLLAPTSLQSASMQSLNVLPWYGQRLIRFDL
jgi:hypothetical protein